MLNFFIGFVCGSMTVNTILWYINWKKNKRAIKELALPVKNAEETVYFSTPTLKGGVSLKCFAIEGDSRTHVSVRGNRAIEKHIVSFDKDTHIYIDDVQLV